MGANFTNLGECINDKLPTPRIKAGGRNFRKYPRNLRRFRRRTGRGPM